jgi:hypothetical protein
VHSHRDVEVNFKNVARCLDWLDLGQGYVATKLKPVAKAAPSKPRVAHAGRDLKGKALMGPPQSPRAMSINPELIYWA